MITLKEVADLTNVSISTVSRVLSNKGNISEETRQRVLSTVNELVRDSGSILMRYNNTSYRIGILIPGTDEYYHDDPTTSVDIRTLIDELEKIGNQVELRKIRDGALDSRAIDEYVSGVDGLILFDPSIDSAMVDHIAERNVPFLITNGHLRDARHNFVDFNNSTGAELAIDHLLSLGHRKIGILAGPERHLVCENRMHGTVNRLQREGISLDQTVVRFGAFNPDSGYSQCHEILDSGREISAIFAFSDFIALGAIKAIKEKGLRVPEDISIVGFDDMEFSKYTEPALTTIHRFERSISYLIARTITDIILYQNTIETVNIDLKTFLVVRESTKALLETQ